jgi:hypothetical protein
MNEEGDRIRKCSGCRLTKLLETYFSKNTKGDYYKTCDKCRDKRKKSYGKNIDKEREYGKKYGKKYRADDRDKCEHNIAKRNCKLCTEPITVTISNWVSHSRTKDKKYDRYDPIKFIDKCFLEGLVEDSDNKCVYCKCDMQFLENNNTLCTIERLDNDLGHNKDNVTLACYSCNSQRNNRYTFEEFIAIKNIK